MMYQGVNVEGLEAYTPPMATANGPMCLSTTAARTTTPRKAFPSGKTN